MVEQKVCFYRVIALYYFFIASFVRSITWRLMVGIQYHFIQWSSTLRESAVHTNHNSILTNYRLIALCYFSLSGALLDNYRLEFKTTSYNGQEHKEEVQCIRTITLSWLITEWLPFVTFPCPEHYLTTTGLNSKQLLTMVKNIKRKCSV
jgi:hypothetical protein